MKTTRTADRDRDRGKDHLDREPCAVKAVRYKGGTGAVPKKKRIDDRGSGLPRRSMYAIYAYIGVVWGVNAGIYGIHGVCGLALFVVFNTVVTRSISQ